VTSPAASSPAATDAPISAAVVGGVAWNLLVQVPRLPTDLTTLHAEGHRWGVGGTGAGKALHLARLGVATRLHALLGDDEYGDHVREAMDAAGVALTAWPDPHGTESHLNLMDPRGDRVSIFLDRSTADPDVTGEDLLTFTRGADLVFVSLTEYSRRVLPLLASAGVPVWVDLHDWDGGGGDFHRPFVEHGDYVFVSDVRLDDPLELATRLAATRRLVVVTHGARGATAFFPDREPLFVPPYDAGPVADTNGAGDAFSVGVAYGVARGWDLPRSLHAGAVLSGGCVAAPDIADRTLTSAWLEGRL
jgi:sugar/nucleoside kinase (ribokinase family)